MYCVCYISVRIKILNHIQTQVKDENSLIVLLFCKFRRKKRKERAIDVSRFEDLDKFLHGTPNNLQRSESTPLANRQPEKELKVPQYVKHFNIRERLVIFAQDPVVLAHLGT